MKKFGIICILVLALSFVLCGSDTLLETAHASDFDINDIPLDSFTYEQLEMLHNQILDRMHDLERQYAIENGNRQIVFDSNSYVLYVGKTKRINASVKRITDDAPNRTNFVWSSSDAGIVSVSGDGLLSAKSKGIAVITCSAKDDDTIFSSIQVEVRVPVAKVTISTTSATLVANIEKADTIQLSASVEPNDAFCQTISWSSSNEEVATVKDGVVKAHKAGHATITATSNDDATTTARKATCMITVGAAVESISLNNVSIKLEKGKTATLNAKLAPTTAINKKLKWSSSNLSVAKVSEKGIVTAVGNGSCKIKCSSTDGSGVEAICDVAVNTMTKKLSISNGSDYCLTKGDTVQLRTVHEPRSVTDKSISWTSSDNKIASVNSSGVVTARKVGKCTITATTKDGSNKTAQITIYVDPVIPAEINYVNWKNMNYGVIRVYLGYKNLSYRKTIDSVTINVELYDTYGNLIDSGNALLDDKTIGPGNSYNSGSYYWIFSGNSNVRKAKVYISKIHTMDGKTYNYTYSQTGGSWSY